MKILQYCNYLSPAQNSMGTERVVEALCSGLTKLGHKVYLWCKEGSTTDTGAEIVHSCPLDVDIVHFHSYDLNCIKFYESFKKPYVGTLHGGGMESDKWFIDGMKNNTNAICISKYISDKLKCPAWAYNCIRPEQFIYNEKKDNYYLWLAGTDWGEAKGLFSAILLAKRMGFRLKIAGSGRNSQIIDDIKNNCNHKIEYVGSVNGKEKAELLSNAKAVLNIGRILDAFCIVNAEALVSGTPVIARNVGCHPEILVDKVAFLCDSDLEIAKAVVSVGKIDPKVCRQFCLDRYSDVASSKEYLAYYENMIKYGRTVK